MKKKSLILRAAVLALVGLLLTGCTAGASGASAQQTAAVTQNDVIQERVSGVGFYFDTVVTITLMDGSQAMLDDIWAECARYERLLSKTVPGSDVQRINTSGGQPVTVDPETWEILKRAKEISEISDHDFSVTIAPLVAMWDFVNGTELMPTDAKRLAALPLVDDDKLMLGEDCTVTLPDGMSIDLGGIAKGYIADKIAEMVRGRVTGAMLNFGGNVYVVGHKQDGSAFRIGIQDPMNATGTTFAIVTLTDASVVTSGIYERYFIKDGVQYHHILDPETGISADSDLASATIILDSSMTADAYATACIVKGKDEALKMLEAQGLDAFLITREGEVALTKGFAEKYSLVLK